MKNKKVILVIGLIIINFSFFIIGYLNYLYPKLSDFTINSVSSKEVLAVNVSKCAHAVEYNVKVKKDDNVIYESTSTKEEILLDKFYPDYDEEVTISVEAKNKNNDKKISSNEFVYKNKEASLKKSESHYVSKSSDLYLNIDGYDETKNYYIELYYLDNIIYDSKVYNDEIVIPSDTINKYSGRITAVLKNENKRILSKYNFYVNTPLVGKLKIISPENELETRWNDIIVKYMGAENANNIYVSLYSNDELKERFKVEPVNNQFKIEANHLMENTVYNVVVEALYEDYTELMESSSFIVYVKAHETTDGVYVSHNPYYIKQNTLVELNSMNSNATIYYTTDGSIPNENSAIYKEPIMITENMTIKTYAHTHNRYDSVVNTYNFNIEEKTPVIYLSPSNQDGNYGVESVNYTTEKDMMNKLGDVVERVLKENGLVVYRNWPSGDINAWTSISNSVHADFHLAIHSNASGTHEARGIEMFVDNETSKSFSIASNIYANLWQIYPANNNESYHRKIKYARGSLGEANDNFLPCGSLIEVAYHDNTEDAAWIVNNLEEIGVNIAKSIINYYK